MRNVLALAALTLPLLYTACVSSPKYFAYVGTYTDKTQSKGVYAYRYDPGDASLVALGTSEVTDPTFLATDPEHKFLYALSEVSAGAVSAFSIDRKSGALSPLNRVSSKGDGPCHISVDHTGKCLFAAHYPIGSVSLLPIEANGILKDPAVVIAHSGSSVNADRQAGPHAHEAFVSPDNRRVFVPDLGLDQVKIYNLDPGKLSLTPNNPAFVSLDPGSGPRHMAFHPNGRIAYVVSELKPTVTVFSYDASAGSFQHLQTIPTMEPAFQGENGPAEIAVDSAGHHLYVSNRGPDTISVFTIDTNKSTLTQTQIVPLKAKWPRFFALDPSGKYLLAAGQKSNSIETFTVDGESGKLTSTGQITETPAPVHILFVPAS